MKKTLSFLTILLFVNLLLPFTTFASEGVVNLTNRIGTDARCFGASILMPDLNYRVLVSCRDITYPGGAEIVNYVVWAKSQTNGNSFKLGELGIGKVEFRTRDAFSSLYVTVERDNNARTPQGNTIMQGNVLPISILENKNSPEAKAQDPLPGEATASPAPSNQKSSIAKFLTGGIIGLIGIGGLIFILFIVTRR